MAPARGQAEGEAVDRSASVAVGPDSGKRAALCAADWLGLAAAPSFAVMALLTGFSGVGTMAIICGRGAEPSWLGGMVPMYLLMSGFHSGSWLKLLADRRWRGGRKSR